LTAWLDAVGRMTGSRALRKKNDKGHAIFTALLEVFLRRSENSVFAFNSPADQRCPGPKKQRLKIKSRKMVCFTLLPSALAL
jgi:hypothetical protein